MASLTTNSKERKETPITTGVLDYFPLAIAAIARVSFKGNQKHNPGQPMHWAREKSTDHADCIVRHLAERDQIAPDSGELHAAHIAWRALAMLQLLEEKRLKCRAEKENLVQPIVYKSGKMSSNYRWWKHGDILWFQSAPQNEPISLRDFPDWDGQIARGELVPE